MATSLADILFLACAAVIVVAQALILRSTARGMRHAGPDTRTALEWAYAIAPAVALLALLATVWMAMHPDAIQVQATAPGIRL